MHYELEVTSTHGNKKRVRLLTTKKSVSKGASRDDVEEISENKGSKIQRRQEFNL
jgi:hypothetical protein